jgi:hypothetical protein
MASKRKQPTGSPVTLGNMRAIGGVLGARVGEVGWTFMYPTGPHSTSHRGMFAMAGGSLPASVGSLSTFGRLVEMCPTPNERLSYLNARKRYSKTIYASLRRSGSLQDDR